MAKDLASKVEKLKNDVDQRDAELTAIHLQSLKHEQSSAINQARAEALELN